MFEISFPRSSLISPTDPAMRIESAIGCNGLECGDAILDEDGNLLDRSPHLHLVESQPGARTRKYPIDGELPT
jgi:hypothetical protein